MIKKVSFSYRKDGRLNGCKLSLTNDIIKNLNITEENNNVIFTFENNIITLKQGKVLLEQEQKTEDGKIFLLLKNYKIKFDKVREYKSPRLIIPLPIVNTLEINEENKKLEIEVSNDQVIIKKLEDEIMDFETNKLGKVYTVKVNKGGVGKTFITVQLASYLALKNKKVLILTSDSQNNIIDYTLKKEINFDKGLKEFVRGGEGEIIRLRPNLDFIPTENSTFGNNFFNNLPEFIEKMKRKYDYVLIDSIPTMKIDSVFVQCSDKIIIPCFGDNVTIKGVINVVKEAGNEKVLAIMMNKYQNKKIQNLLLTEIENVISETDILFPKPMKNISEVEELLYKGKTIWESNSLKLSEIKEVFEEVAKAILNPKENKKEDIFDISF